MSKITSEQAHAILAKYMVGESYIQHSMVLVYNSRHKKLNRL